MSRARRDRHANAHRARRNRAYAALEIALWVIVFGLLIYRVTPQVRAAFGSNASGAPAPSVAFHLLDGGTATMEQLHGQVVLVNFWATWCPPCRFEMPGFQKVYDARKAAGFTILGVSADEGPSSQVAAFLADRSITYPVAMATPEVLFAFGGVNSFPTSFLIDRQGRIRYTVRGIFAQVALSQAVDRLLAERD